MRKPYDDVKLPSWVLNGNKDRLIDHIKYLTHENDKHKRLYRKKLREVRELRGNDDE